MGSVAVMIVSEALKKRTSIRQFTSEPVSDEILRGMLETEACSPSGGNMQPWRIYVVNGGSMGRLREFLRTKPPLEEPEYDMYPAGLTEPYRTNRFTIGEQMYGTMGIAREDKDARRKWFGNNNDFFGAPAAIFCFLDRQMGEPQWSDCGMFLQSFMLLAVENGLSTCPQEYWSLRHGAISEFVGAPENEMLFCGVAVGHADWNHPVNGLRSERMPFDMWGRFV